MISFKLKLILSYAFVIIISLGLIAFFLDKSLEDNSLRNIESSLVTQALLIEGGITPESLKKEDVSYLEPRVSTASLKAKCRITVISVKGRVLADSEKTIEEIPNMENHIGRPEIMDALAGKTGIDIRYSPTLKINMLYAAIPVMDRKEVAGVLRLALPLESVQKTLSVIRRIILSGFVFALIFAFILGSIFAARTIKPINRMIHVSRHFSQGDFTRRVVPGPADEIGELAATFNHMAQGIEDKMKEVGGQNQKLAAVFNSMVEGIIVVDKEGRIVSINPAIENIFAISRKDVEGRLFLEAIRNNDVSDMINGALASGKVVHGEIVLLYPVQKTFEVTAAPIFDSGAVSGSLAVVHDITELKRLETVRSDFVANVSHELKTPLTSIKGFIETLLDGALEDKENNRNFLKIIQEHADRLDDLVSDLLSLSHLESKEIELEKSDVNLKKDINEIILGFRSQLNKKGITVDNALPPGLFIRADENRVKQVFTNLIDNAIKFNKEKGAVKIYSTEKNGAVTITIEDSGIGIPAKDIPRIFERFYRVDKARSRSLGGTGLGLSIVKHIVELHEGAVGVESTEGFGSKFWLTLPK